MLEASEHESVDVVFYFFAAIVEECFDFFESAYITRVLTKYVDMISAVYKHHLNSR